MFRDRKVIVVMPAYNAGKTLQMTLREVDRSIVDEVILVDDCSHDDTVEVARRLDVHTVRHEQNLGYGGNQKTCYTRALDMGADVVVMLHPDYQYTPKLIPAIVALIGTGLYDVVLASRILGGQALSGGMPLHKYLANRALTFVQNAATGMKLSEFHTGYRAFTREVLLGLPLHRNSNGFLFDNEILLQAHFAGFRIAELTCPTKYFAEASSINLRNAAAYGLGCLWNCVLFSAARRGVFVAPIFSTIEPRRNLATPATP